MDRDSIILSSEGLAPEDFVGDLRALLEDTRYELHTIERHSRGPMAAVELLLATKIFLFIGTAVATGFLSEAGADQYRKLCKLIAKTADRFRREPSRNSELKFSTQFSIEASVRGAPTKLVFPLDASVDEMERASDAFLCLVRGEPMSADEGLIAILTETIPMGGRHLLAFDRTSGRLRRINVRYGDFEED
jgi:hypothetical protein